jgi:hypothetical protein
MGSPRALAPARSTRRASATGSASNEGTDMTAAFLRLTCKQAHRVITEAMDRDLQVMEDVKVRLHLRRCPGCAGFVKQMDLMRSAMRRVGR